MSWLGGLNDSFNQLSSITGQIGGQLSNFTKEVLTESGDENIDYEVEARRLGDELKQNEALISTLKRENSILKEKVHSAELQVSTSSIEYEAKLHEKTKEVSTLKQSLSSDTSKHHTSGIGTPILASSFSNVSLADDDEDFHDLINYQREINRLSRDLDEARAEAEKWKKKAKEPKSTLSNGSAGYNADLSFEGKIRELEDALRREADHHQQEMRAIQDAHAAAINRYQEEVRKSRVGRSDSPALDSPRSTSNESILHHHKEENKKLESELNSLKDQMRNRNRQLQMQKKQLEELTASLKEREEELREVKESKKVLFEERERVESEMSKLETENEKKIKKLGEIAEGLSSLFSVEEIPVNFDRENVGQSLVEFVRFYHRSSEERIQILAENAELHTRIETLQNRVTELEDLSRNASENLAQGAESLYDTELAESDQWHQDGLNQAAEEDQNIESDQHRRRHLPPHLDFGPPLGHSSPHVPSTRQRTNSENLGTPMSQNPGDLTLTLQALRKQVDDYELEIEQYEQVQSEWQAEKRSLQELLNRYQNEVAQGEEQVPSSEPEDERAATVERLKRELTELKEMRGALERETNRLVQEKEQLQVATKNLSEELNTSIAEAQAEKDENDTLKREVDKYQNEKEKLQAAYEVLTQELNKSREEREDLDQALDALDTQHQDEMSQLLSVRDDMKEKMKSVQNQLKLEQESNEDLRKKLDYFEQEERKKSQNLQDASQEADERMKSLEDRLKVLEREKKLLEEKDADSDKNLIKMTEENEKILSSSMKMKTSLEESERKRKMLEENITGLKKGMMEKEEELENHRTKVNDAEARFSKLESEFSAAKRKMEDETRRKDFEFQEQDSRIAAFQSQLTRKDEDSLQMKTEIQEEEKSLRILQISIQEKDALVGKLKLEKQRLEERFSSEVTCLEEEIEALGGELENAGKEMAESQSKYEDEVRRMQREKQDEISKIHKDSQEKLNLLNSSQESSKSEADATNKVYLEKISHLEKLNQDLQQKLDNIQTEDVAKITKLSQENETLVRNLRQKLTDLTDQYNVLLEQHTVLKNSTQNEKNLLENRLKIETEQKIQSQKECNELKNLLQKANDVEASLSAEMTALRLELQNSERKIVGLTQKLEEKDRFVPEKDPKNDEKVQSLMEEIENLKSQLSEKSGEMRPNVSIEDMLGNLHDFSELEKSDLSKDDIGSLLQLIKERDNVIEVLRQRQPPNLQNSTYFAEVKRLEDANQSLTAEKDQILAVISEKTRENKKLKDEAHKMMSLMAESRAALEKVQQENAALLAKYEGYDKEMTKEAVIKLSRLVTEKDLEIEALKQKSATLLEVLQQQPGGGGGTAPESMVSGQQVQNLIRDKETLSGQVQQLLNERNHLVALLNQRQIEVDEARVEVSKAAEALEHDTHNNSKLQIDYGNLVHDYDQTQLKLSAVQKELSNFREKMSQIEGIKNMLVQKLEISDETEPKISSDNLQGSPARGQGSPSHGGVQADQRESQRTNELSETLEQRERILQQFDEDNSRKSIEIEKLQNDSREKDLLIHSRMEEMNRAKRDLAARTNEAEILRKSVENLREQVSGLGKNCEEARAEVRNFSSRLEEKEAESQAFQETNAQLSMLLKEKEYELENAREKCERLENMTKENQEGKETESQRLLVELDNAKMALIAARHERDQVMLSLKQKKIEGDKSAEEARSLREKEVKLESELTRLRNHLVQVEEAYTQEAVLAEDRTISLREQLEKTKSTHNAAREATELSQQQAESLQEQLRTALSQRDQAIQQLQLTQEQGMQYATALQKLQVAVERMQREEAANFAEQLDKIKVQLQQKSNAANTFESMANDLKAKLENANEALKSASRLNNQLELKEENITQLKNIIAEKQVQIDGLQDKVHYVTSKSEGMVDKEIVKNLIIGYFTSPNNKRPDVLRLIEGVLGFSQQETRKVNSGPPPGGARGWIGGWLGWRGDGGQQRQSMSVPASPRTGAANESFTQMFVKFLENESVPHQMARLPAAAMVNEAQQRRRPPLSPVLSSVPTPVGFTSAERAGPSVAGRYSPYLLSTTGSSTPNRGPGLIPTATPLSSHSMAPHPITPVLPTFTPIINPKPAAEQEILQDILLSGNEKR